MFKNKEYYLGLNYEMTIVKNAGKFVASYKEYPKVLGCGRSEVEAVADLKDAFSCLLDVLLEDGEAPLEPKEANLPREKSEQKQVAQTA